MEEKRTPRVLYFLLLVLILGVGLIGKRLEYSYVVLPKTTSNDLIRIDNITGSMWKFDAKKKTWEPTKIDADETCIEQEEQKNDPSE